MTMVKVEEEKSIKNGVISKKTEKSVPFCDSSRLMIFTLPDPRSTFIIMTRKILVLWANICTANIASM